MSWFNRKSQTSILNDQKNKAFADLQKQFANDPTLPRRQASWLVQRANQQVEQGAAQQAITDLEEAFMLDHSDSCVLVRLSVVLRANGRAVEAAALLNSFSKSMIDRQDILQQIQFYNEKGDALILSGSVPEGISYLKQALHLARDNQQVIVNMAAAGTVPHCAFVAMPNITQLITQLQIDVDEYEADRTGGRPLLSNPA